MMRTRLLLLAALSLAAAACVRETPVQIDIIPGEEMVIHASLEYDAPGTKTLRDESDGAVLWAPGDRISLFYGSGTAGGSEFTSMNETNASVTDFTGNINVGLDNKWFWGIYPYNTDNECDGTGAIITLPAVQTAVAGTFAPGTFVSIGRSKSAQIPFYNVCGGLKFRVEKEGVKRVVLRSFDGPIAGKARVVFDEAGKPLVEEILEGSDVIALEAPGGQTLQPGQNYYFSIFPHVFTERFFSVTFETENQIGIYQRAGAFTVSRSIFEGFNAAMDSAVPEWIDVAGRISTPEEMQDFLSSGAAAASKGALYLVTADIDMSCIASVASATSFAGILDGGSHIISGISSSKPLIQTLTGTVRNLTLDSDCSFTPGSGSTFGAIAGTSSGSISSVVTKAEVSLSAGNLSASTLVAGIAGYSSGSIEYCRNEGNVNVTASGSAAAVGVAGLAGYLEAPMSGCVNEGDISFSARNLSGKTMVRDIASALPTVGGLVAYGDPTGFEMSSCTNRGSVSFSVSQAELGHSAALNRNQVGGVVGSPSGPVTGCSNYGDVNVSLKHSTPGTAISAYDYIVCAGGIGGGDYYFTSTSGTISYTSYTDCINEGTVTVDSDASKANSAIGGIVGWPGQEVADPLTSASGCINRGTITVRGAMKCRVGGVEGGSGVMNNCTNEGLVHVESCDAASAAGSLCGFHSRGHAITGCTAGGSVICDTQLSGGVGGLIGNIGNVAHNTATGCSVNCSITVPAFDYKTMGFVVGVFNGTSTTITLGSSGSKIQVGGNFNGVPAAIEIVRGAKNRNANHVIYTDLGTDDGSAIPEPNVVPPALTEDSINGTAILGSSDVAGLIKDSSTGLGIPGVAVSDGYSVVTTDANGVFQMQRDSRSRKIYYTTPAAYKINLDPINHLPCFFTPGILDPAGRYRADFSLTPLDAPENEFTLFMIGDPQCTNTTESGRYKNETVSDIKAIAGNYSNVYCVTLGDITFDSTDMWDEMVSTMSNVRQGSGRYIPFFQTIGNHDHNSLESDTGDDTDDDYRAVAKYVEKFGPTDYSFDRGDAHIIVMDDIIVKSLDDSASKPNKKTWRYDGGFTDDQFSWLQQDLNNVSDKNQKVGFLCLHIPFRGGGGTGGGSIYTARHYSDVLNLLRSFKEFHIMIGHTHYQQNYIHNKTTAGGTKIYEHIHGAACGAWWAADCNLMGSPNGYTIYTVHGNNVTNWVMKGANRPADYQLRVYDGNDTFTGNKNISLNWYSEYTNVFNVDVDEVEKKYVVNVNGFHSAQNSFVAEVFNDDAENWTVQFWQNGEYVGDFIRAADGGIHNMAVCSFWFNQKNKKTTSWNKSNCSHYWYYTPASGDPSSETNWEVRAIQTIPTNTSQVNTYTCNELTKDYSCFEKP